MTSKVKIGPMLRLVLSMGRLVSPMAEPMLRRRLARGKEDPDRWREKLGEASEPRPEGRLVWLHGVGVGEVMALRGLIDHLAAARPELQFLITSSARSSGKVVSRNLPPNTRHQYLPLDLPGPVAAFLDHWRPDLAVWSDQEVWPRLAVEVAQRGIAQAYVAARITDASARAKARFGRAYGDLYRLFDLRHAQDSGTAAHLAALMGDASAVQVTGSLKSAGAPLAVDAADLDAFESAVARRRVWLLASSHAADEAVALAAHKQVLAADKRALLIIAPRRPERAAALLRQAQDAGLQTAQRSADTLPEADTQVYVADTVGELGLWYRAAPVALIGGSFDATQGHNPWEAVTLGAAVLHGPKVENFSIDYKVLRDASGCQLVQTAEGLAKAVLSPDTPQMPARAAKAQARMRGGVERITRDLLMLLGR